jgi:PBP1b-binding outer membrane lipoprotein LpoB
MKKYLIQILIVLILTSCSSLKNSSSTQNENLDVAIFNKGVVIFEILEETSFDYELNNIDTTSIEGKIRYETLYNKKEDILDFAFEQFEIVIEDYC